MMKWTQQVVNWKNLNVNKVSELFDTCRRLCMLMLDEMERLAVDLFLEENELVVSEILVSDRNNMGLHIARLY